MAIVHRVTVTDKKTGGLLESKDFENRVSADLYADELDRKYQRTPLEVRIEVESVQG
jgi:hypothetical protein